MVEQFFRLEYLVPAEHAIGGKAYWHPFDAKHFNSIREGIDAFSEAEKVHDAAGIRLVRVDVHLVCERLPD